MTIKIAHFEDMSLTTLASLYLDCFENYDLRKFYPQDKALIVAIQAYITLDRHDECFFYPIVDSLNGYLHPKGS